MEGSYQLSDMSAPLIKTKLPGPKSLEYLNIQQELETKATTYPKQFRIALRKARGSTVEDMDGNIFIDWFGGICVLNLGHANPIVLNAIKKQIEDVIHINEVPTEARINFLKSMNQSSPGKLKNHSKILTTTTGADACEAAIKIARTVTKKKTIVAFGGAYHGISGGVVEATANYHYRNIAGMSYGNFYHLPFPYKYRFPLKIKEEEISNLLGDQLEYLIKDPYAGPGPVAGVMLEPIQGEGGYVIPPDDFIPIIKEITEKYSIPLIADEIQSGVGRTGKIWAVENYNVTPDIMCVSKSIGGGIPLSAVVYNKDYDNALDSGFHVGTYRGNPLGLAAGSAILDYLRTSDVLDKVNRDGAYLLKRLEELQEDTNILGEARGKGFMVATEMVTDKISREPATEITKLMKTEMFQRGLLMHSCGHYSNVLRFMAPLTIERELIDKGLQIYSEALQETKIKSGALN